MISIDAGKEEQTLTIANGAAITSTGAALGAGRVPCGLILSGWTSAVVSFDVSLDDSTYYPLIDEAGEYTLVTPSAVNSGVVAIGIKNPTMFLAWKYVKIRSGTKGSTTNQGAARTITLISRLFA